MQLHTFKKGVHPPYEKSWTEDKPIRAISHPSEVIVPLIQHIGAPNRPLVKKKDLVKKGQIIGDADGFVTCPVHSPVSGKVKAVERRPHQSGMSVESVVITSDGEDQWVEGMEKAEGLDKMSPEAMGSAIRQAGISGMGGASFPTHVKLSPPKDTEIEALILNGSECEPYITADHRLMVEQPEKVIYGLKVFKKALGAPKAYICIEDNKPEAIKVMGAAAEKDGSGIEIKCLESKYPQGGEKMLIQAIMGNEVPSGKLPAHAGALVQNVGTAVAAANAIREGLPLIERVVTVSGPGIKEPDNLLVKIGTPIQHCIDACGGLTDDARMVILGGPMMGSAVSNLQIPIMKGFPGIVVLTGKELDSMKPRVCIGCGRCVSVCPMGLLPTRLARYSEFLLLEKAARGGLSDCIECGCCSFVCPSAIPLVQWIRYGKYKAKEERRTAGAVVPKKKR